MNLLAYIQGKRKGKEAHRIEKEAMRNPFLAEALEGYDEVDADHAKRIARLRSRMPSATRQTGQQKIYIGIAASLLFCLMAGGYFTLNKKPENLIAMNETHTYTEEIATEPVTETKSPPPPPNYLTENEIATVAQSEMRQRETSSSLSPVSPASPVVDRRAGEPVVVDEAYAQVQAEIVVSVEDERVELALDAGIVAVRQAEVEEELDDAAVAVLDEEGRAESRAIAASRTVRSDLAKEKPSAPEPQIGMEAYQKYLKEAMNPLKMEECPQTTGVIEVEFKLKEGKPSDFIIKQSFCDAASKEALRLIENGCLWIGEDGQTAVLNINF